ncbi:PAS domain-containing sensor histidine kinase [Phenylobacterium sp.]|uniref:PAS domain-containing sensor histidine kinase n=1 Tax=Phenylobacterium sp. TaxID=1871053 RepID=UPI00300297C0
MDQSETEAALRRSEHRYRNLFQAMAASFWELDFFPVGDMLRSLRKQGVADYAAYFADNPGFVRDMMRATRVVDVNDQAVALFGRGDKAELLADVEPFWPEASTPVFAASVIAAVTGQPNYAAETRLRSIAGDELEVLFTACFPPETMNKGTLLIGVIDVTERNRAQAALARLQADFAHAARVSMLGELTASISHEVNQPLAAIATNAAAGQRWLARETPDVAEVQALIARIQADAERAAAIISRIRGMAGGQAPESSQVDLNGVIEDAVAFLRHEIESQQTQLVLNLAPHLPPVLGDRTQLQQVVANLMLNALQAMAGQPPQSRTLSLTSRAGPDDVIALVSDSGPGVPDSHQGRLFDSFFTTRAAGMGMGLAICRSILDAHGGDIGLADEAPGACFRIRLPQDLGTGRHT